MRLLLNLVLAAFLVGGYAPGLGAELDLSKPTVDLENL